jgi:hypothetical protein
MHGLAVSGLVILHVDIFAKLEQQIRGKEVPSVKSQM